MKGLKSIKEWALRVFALIIKTVAPTMAVKFFTIWFAEGRSWYKANAKERAKLFLPGVAKEVQAIQKLNLTESQLRRRVWSDGTCEALLKQGDTSLYFLAKSDEAYDLITKTGKVEVIVEVFRAGTPNVAYLKKWLLNTERKLVLAVIAKSPSIFNDLKVDDLKMEYISALVASDANVSRRWAEKVFGVLIDSDFNTKAAKEERELFDRAITEECELFDCAMGVLLDVDYDFTKYLEKLERCHEEWYGEIRNRAGQSSHLVSYLVERIPEVWFRANFSTGYEVGKVHHLESFDEGYNGENWPRVMDARKWLKLAYENLSSEVIKVCLDHITNLTYENPCGAIVKMQERLVQKVEGYELIRYALSKLPEQYHWQLKAKLYGSISSYAEAREAMRLLPKSYRKGLRAKMAEILCQYEADEFIRTYFPFGEWEQENAEAAVRKLAQLKALPFDRLGELTEELRNAALDEVDVVAEMETLLVDNSETSTPGQEEKELLKRQLHPRSEVTLFTRGHNWHEVKLEYISNFRMSKMGFVALVNHQGSYGDDERRGRELVRAHAEKWGLTEGEYLALTRSPYYSDLAAPLKGCKPAEAKAEELNNDEKSA